MARLRTTYAVNPRHTDAVTSVAWAGSVFLSASDDKSITKWNPDGEWGGQVVATTDYGVNDLHSCPGTADFVACACSDGCVRLLSNGKEEKKLAASSSGAAITSVRWSYDGSAFVSASEDGSLKVWSKSGMLRTTLASVPRCVFSVRWAVDNNCILYSSGTDLSTVSLQGDTSGAGNTATKPTTWKAHDGVVLCCDWSGVHGRIVSGGEDGRYRVWDSLGRPLFSSSPGEQPVTAVAWAPSGTHFLAGSFRSLRLCHSSGWSAYRESVAGGSVMSIAWSPDSTLIAAAVGDGSVGFSTLLGRTETVGSLTATQTDPSHLVIRDSQPTQPSSSTGVNTAAAHKEDVHFRDRITDFVVSESHIVAATPSQIHFLGRGAWHVPHAIDMRSACVLLVASARNFMAIDGTGMATIYGYDGRAAATLKLPGLRPEISSRSTVSIASDAVCYLDRTDDRTIRLLDIRTGSPPQGTAPYVHPSPVSYCALSHGSLGGNGERAIILTDSSNALFLLRQTRQAPLAGHSPAQLTATKLAAVCDGVVWADSGDSLVAVMDGDIVSWLALSGLESDMELTQLAKVTLAGGASVLGPMPTLLGCAHGRLSARKADGTELHVPAPGGQVPGLLADAVLANRWEDAVRLCRFTRSPPLWAALACMALAGAGRHLDTAEVALAALGAVDRLEWVTHVKAMAVPEERAAELAVYRRAYDEGEAILLQAGLRVRAVKLNIRLGRWARALELARTAPSHVDSVLLYRARYLQAVAGPGKPPALETLEPLKAAAASWTGPLDWAAVKAARRAEKEREARAVLTRLGTASAAGAAGMGARPHGGRTGAHTEGKES